MIGKSVTRFADMCLCKPKQVTLEIERIGACAVEMERSQNLSLRRLFKPADGMSSGESTVDPCGGA